MKDTRILARKDAVNVSHMVQRCRVLGPGERFVLWAQGCPLRCPGCHNPQFQPFRDACWLPIECLEERILSVQGIEGVTYVGGEPFAQAQALTGLSRRLRQRGLTVMVYSGFTYEELEGSVLPHSAALLRETDLLLDGPYRQDLPSDRPWRGSENQRLIALSKRYRKQLATWDEPTGRQFEVRLDENGGIEILGIPPGELVEQSIAFHTPGSRRRGQ